MLETFDSATGWTAGTDAANITTDTGTVKQGTASLEWDKTGSTSATTFVQKLLGVPVDMHALRLALANGSKVSCQFNHANFTNFDKVAVRFVYRFDSSGVADVFDVFELATLTGAAWNELSVNLDAPTSSTGTPTNEHRSHCIAYQIVVTMDDAAHTFSDLFVDALTIKPTTGTASPGLLAFDSQRLLLPPFDAFNRNVDPKRIANITEAAAENILHGRKQAVEALLAQVRHPADASARVYGLEDSLRLFELYAQESVGWGVSNDANAIVDTTCDGAATAGELELDVVSAVDIAYIGTTGQDLRIGPNAARRFERVRVVSISTNKLYLDRPLRYAHETGTKVRSVDHYPNCVMAGDTCIREADQAVTFNLSAIEVD
jgi:hypothetical protein